MKIGRGNEGRLVRRTRDEHGREKVEKCNLPDHCFGYGLLLPSATKTYY